MKLRIDYLLFMDESMWAAYSPVLEVVGDGSTKEEVIDSLKIISQGPISFWKQKKILGKKIREFYLFEKCSKEQRNDAEWKINVPLRICKKKIIFGTIFVKI
jgi:hypothetical protein